MTQRNPQRVAARFLIREASRSRLSLTDMKFNLREICKQMLLLEDHLFHREKYCPDCITKHLLMIEAFADEAMTFEDRDEVCARISEMARSWLASFADGCKPEDLGQWVRVVRKQLTPRCFDPRTA